MTVFFSFSWRSKAYLLGEGKSFTYCFSFFSDTTFHFKHLPELSCAGIPPDYWVLCAGCSWIPALCLGPLCYAIEPYHTLGVIFQCSIWGALVLCSHSIWNPFFPLTLRLWAIYHVFLRHAIIETKAWKILHGMLKKKRSIAFIRKRWEYIHFSEHSIFSPNLMPALGLHDTLYECGKPAISTIPAGSCSSYCYLGVVRLTHSSSYTWLSVTFWSPLLCWHCSGRSQSLWSARWLICNLFSDAAVLTTSLVS